MTAPAERILGLALIGAVLAFPAAASGAKPEDPGAQGNAKNDEAAAPAPAAPAPVQQPAPQQKTDPVKPVKVEGAKPVTQGTLKKAPAATTTAPSSATAGSTASSGSRRTTRASRGSSRSARRSNAGGATRGRARAREVERLNAEERAERRAARRAAERRRAERERAGRARRAADARAEDDEAGSSFHLTRAAEDVVEVIPGAVLLAMTGLGGLVMLLVARSWVTERRRGQALAESYGVTVQALATAIEAKDHTTGGHIERVRDLGLLLARELGLRDVRDPQMAYGFLLHDVGKLAVPDAVLRHPGQLSDDAWGIMRRHPEEGVRILSEIPFLDRALDVVRHHHERWDGSGYPAGLAGQEIPLWARIFSVVDALDAMTADRPYRAAMSYEDALAEIRRHAGTQFDPDVVEALERLDPGEVVSLLEPAQARERQLPDGTGNREPLEALLAAAGRGRPEREPVNGNGVPLSELVEPAPEPRANLPV